MVGDELGEAAGGDHLCPLAELAPDGVHDALDLAGEAVHGCRLKSLGGRLADRVLGFDQLDLDELGGARRERLEGHFDARRDGAAHVVAFGRDDVEGGGGAVVGDDAGTAVLLELSLIHISEPTRLGMISYAVFCLKKKKKK